MGPHLNWVVLVSFTPFLYSGLYFLFSFGSKILLTLTLGSRKYFLPGSLVFQTMAWSIRRLRSYSLMLSRELVPIALAISFPPTTTMDDYIHMSFILSFPIVLVITRCNELPYRGFVRHQLSWVPIALWITIRSSEILRSHMFMTFLTCLHYG